MTEQGFWGVVLWALIFYPVWSPRCRRIRRETRLRKPVSRNRETGPAWEQDAPFSECFDTMEDDL